VITLDAIRNIQLVNREGYNGVTGSNKRNKKFDRKNRNFGKYI